MDKLNACDSEVKISQTVPPQYGLKVKLDHKYPEIRGPNMNKKWKQIAPLIPLTLRYLGYHCKCKMQRIKPTMDFINLEKTRCMYGCPLGGIGGGTIGRGYKGEFCRYQLRPGVYEYISYPENQFIINIKDENQKTIYQSVLSTYTKPKKAPKSWLWNLDGSKCEYTGLYPRAWTTYDLSIYGIVLVGRQISPVIPHNYKDSSLPCAVFVWDIQNVSEHQRTVSIVFTFRNTNKKVKKDKSGDLTSFERYCDNDTCGVSLESYIGDMSCTFTVAKKKQTTDSTTDGFCKFNTKQTADHLWSCLEREGRLLPDEIPVVPKYPANAMGLSNHAVIETKQRTSLEFCLVWDMPVVHFVSSDKKYQRYYTRFFGSEGMAGPSIASYSLLSYKKWEDDICEWQNPILSDETLPSWYKGALFNQLYYITDGGTVWFDVSDSYPKDDPRWTYGLFGYLEGHEYRMYNTYDVHFYASFALAQLWPRLQVSLQYDFKDAVWREIGECRKCLFSGTRCKRKYKDGVPHDLGDPYEDPFTLINAYNIHNVDDWRDLNLKFILQVFRDYTLLKAEEVKQLHKDKYRSLEFIDDASDDEDLYFRSTNQVKEEEDSQTRMIEQILNHRIKVKQMTNHCKPKDEELKGSKKSPREKHVSICSNNSDVLDSGNHKQPHQIYRPLSDEHKPHKDDEIKLNRFSPREKHISICSTDFADADSAMRAPHVMRQNSHTKTFQLLALEEMLVEDVVDAERYLNEMYPTCRMLFDKIIKWGKNKDGLIENTGKPDQTFDIWVMRGVSSYCGSLWLAALQCLKLMASLQNKMDDCKLFSTTLEKANSAFDAKLWNGSYYDFDEYNNVIMADQLCGQWYLRACGFQHPVFPKEKVTSALKTIYENNVMKFADGKLGAVNGFVPGSPGHKDYSSFQSEEVWTGVVYGLSALMLHEGMIEEGFKTAGGMHNSLSNRFGMTFDTPEALYEDGSYRSIGYMRPLCIWAMHHALNITSLNH